MKNNQTLPQGVVKRVIKKLEESKDVLYELKFQENYLIFEKSKILKNESEKVFNLTEALAVAGKVFYDRSKQEIFETAPDLGNVLIKRDVLKWTLTKESKIIGQYKCFKAFTYIIKEGSSGKLKKLITAWFTTDISIPVGPSYFQGLPGLVLELYEQNGILYTVEKIDLNPEKEIVIKKPKGKVVSIEEINHIANSSRQGG